MAGHGLGGIESNMTASRRVCKTPGTPEALSLLHVCMLTQVQRSRQACTHATLAGVERQSQARTYPGLRHEVALGRQDLGALHVEPPQLQQHLKNRNALLFVARLPGCSHLCYAAKPLSSPPMERCLLHVLDHNIRPQAGCFASTSPGQGCMMLCGVSVIAWYMCTLQEEHCCKV